VSDRFDLLVKGGTLVTPAGIAPGDVGIAAGRVAAIGDLGSAAAAETVDATGLHVLPGLIDTQVHFREPGNEHKENLEAGTRGAVLGGITAVFEMPNTSPTTTTAEALADKVTRATGRAWCDFAFYVGAADENADRLGELERLPGCCGVKVFMGSSTGSLLVEDDEVLRRVLASGSRRVAIHAEDEHRLRDRFHLAQEEGHARAHPHWRDVETAVLATKRLLRLARETGRKVHVLHISTMEEMDILREHKDIATVEVTPQHLTLAAPDCYEELGNFAQMNPPIREARHREGIWRAVDQGIVDVMGSDHAPHTREEKHHAYPKSHGGMPGVQTTVPIMLDHVNAGRLTLLRLVDLLAYGPARAFGIARKGRLAVGYDGDLTLVDLKAKRTIENAQMASICGWTPFDGKAVTGWPIATVIHGKVVMRDGAVVGTPSGVPLRFTDCLG